MKLLLVDDDAFLRDMYAIKFGEAGFEVEIAGTGEQAISIFRTHPDFDVILLDMVLPGLSGIEVITTLREIAGDTPITLIVLSNQGQESDIAEATRAGADGYIIKAEAIPSDVVARVQDILAQK